MTAITQPGRLAPSSRRWPLTSLGRRRLAFLASERKAAIGVALVAAPLAGLAVALAMPRGPVTTAQALSLMALGSGLGLLTGLLLRSRWAMLLAPVGYAAFFELGWGSSQGPTVDGLHLGSIWGIAAAVIGRGFHGVVALAPMLVGAAVGAALARRHVSVERRAGTWRYVRGAITVVASAALVGLAVLIAQPVTVPPVLAANGQAVPGSIAELAKVKIGGVTQWLEIRGQSRDKPVLLFIPGGPGQSDLSFSRVLFANLTRDFVVVAWDGRGIGKAYPSYDPKTLTTDRVVADTIEVTNYLRRRFDEKKIYLAGESGGTITGVLAVERHPELYYAWIGSGQMVDPRETDIRIHRDLVAYATRVGDNAA
ncbi:MAG: proline iminopeptidase, partial [Gaiellaceae bacterium]|nr:proline iminopeptidase [Gaiellaceae bacterium]